MLSIHISAKSIYIVSTVYNAMLNNVIWICYIIQGYVLICCFGFKGTYLLFHGILEPPTSYLHQNLNE